MKHAMTICVIVILAIGSAQATTLADLLEVGATLQSGNLVFSRFGYSNENIDTEPLNLSQVSVTAYESGGQYGFEFTFNDENMWDSLYPEYSFSRYNHYLWFEVNPVTNTNINGITQTFSASYYWPEEVPTLSLTKIVFVESSIAIMGVDLVTSVDITYEGEITSNLYDNFVFDPWTYSPSLPVEITLGGFVNGFAEDNTGYSRINSFNLTFSQVPEPATMVLLALGGLLLRRRKA
jgi:hypothetical protein